ncbi:MAG: twin-arginine translocase TatA/TatE family subunit [Dysgonamonadaceae bacterium]|jgi:sec-independent protein translocase protein TatA|nr:twin-arginine translocase TatA/TatE family subunit [Dysgonamonadaceae bacterium]
MNTLLFSFPMGWQVVILVLLVLLFFGGKKIPEMMKGLGKGINQFKQGLKEVEDDIKTDITDDRPIKN